MGKHVGIVYCVQWQGTLGDCYLVSAMSVMAAKRELVR